MCFICLKLVCLISSCRYDQNLSRWNSTSHVIDRCVDPYMPLCSLHLRDESSVWQKNHQIWTKMEVRTKTCPRFHNIFWRRTRGTFVMVNSSADLIRPLIDCSRDPSPTARTSRPASYVSMLCFTMSVTELLLALVMFVCSIIISWAWL